MSGFFFETSSLWRSSLGERVDDEHKKARDRLRTSFFALRDNVTHLVQNIPTDCPGLTLHDVENHIDHLWAIGSEIAGDDYPFNAAEGFVLGGAFLLHDAGLSLAALPNGFADLQNTDHFKDSLVLAFRILEGIEMPHHADLAAPPPKVLQHAVFETLRVLHPAIAETLPFTGLLRDNKELYLLDDSFLRDAYGTLVGRIAASHWYDVKDLPNLLPITKNAPHPFPREWTIDPIKIACLLRTADAAHIDSSRAPSFRMALVKPHGVSLLHWTAQNKVDQPVLVCDTLKYTSAAFRPEETMAWWQCVDLIRLVDRELRRVDGLLQDLLPEPLRFKARRVSGAESLETLANSLPTQGWKPVDVQIHASDIKSLIQTFGGVELYGDDASVPLRELIQNSADAIRIYRVLHGKPVEYGQIDVCLRDENGDTWLDVRDNGVGMSFSVLAHELLDFGKSLWKSSRLTEEFPGALGKGFLSSGQFGIGFFSVFIISDQIRLVTRRYNLGEDHAYTLEFADGLVSRPIVKQASRDDLVHLSNHCGTIVSIKLRQDASDVLKVALTPLIRFLCPTIDVTIVCDLFGQKEEAIIANDWHRIDGKCLLQRFIEIHTGTSKIDQLTERNIDRFFDEQLNVLLTTMRDPDGTVYGRACIRPPSNWGGFPAAEVLWDKPRREPNVRQRHSYGCITSFGLYVEPARDIIGVLASSRPIDVRRSRAEVHIPQNVWDAWVLEQQQRCIHLPLTDVEKLELAWILAQYSDEIRLPVACMDGAYVTIADIVEEVAKKSIYFMSSLDKWAGQEIHHSTTYANVLCTFNYNFATHRGAVVYGESCATSKGKGGRNPLELLIMDGLERKYGNRLVVDPNDIPPDVQKAMEQMDLVCALGIGMLRLDG